MVGGRFLRVLGGDLASRILIGIGDVGPVAPPGFVLLLGADGAQLLGADGAPLYGVA